MNGDSPSVQPQRGGDLQHLLAHPAEAPALPGLPLQQAAQAMQAHVLMNDVLDLMRPNSFANDEERSSPR